MALDANDVKDDFFQQGYQVTNVTRMRSKRENKNPLPMVVATTTRGEQGKKIYELKTVCHLVVRVETKAKKTW